MTNVRRFWRAIGFALIAGVIWLSLTPHPLDIDVPQGDKVGHFLAYGVLMFWFAQLSWARRERIRYAAGFVALGIALEFAQRLTGYRVFEISDMAANAVGVLFGWFASPPRGPDLICLVERMLPRAQ